MQNLVPDLKICQEAKGIIKDFIGLIIIVLVMCVVLICVGIGKVMDWCANLAVNLIHRLIN